MKKYEIIEFEQDGVKIDIELNYEKGQVSFVQFNHDLNIWETRDFAFANRGIEHLGGWFLLLKTLQEATELANIKLHEQAELRRGDVV